MNVAKLVSVGEKAHYPFKSYPTVQCKTLLFPGCAFPSQFPRTMDALAGICRSAGIGIAYDCCGNPLEGFGEQQSAERVIRNLNWRFAKLGVKRLVLVCPNCLAYFEGKIDCQLASIYEIFEELGVSCKGSFGQGKLFIPCPDMKSRTLEGRIRACADLSAVETMKGVACCGLRPDIASRGPDYVRKLTTRIIDAAGEKRVYTYCASCLGQFSRFGCTNCSHAVSVMLGIDEQPDSSRAFLNRAKRKFDRNTNPLGSPVA